MCSNQVDREGRRQLTRPRYRLAGHEGRRPDRRAGAEREEGKSFSLNIKGPELLNKYVSETDRHIYKNNAGTRVPRTTAMRTTDIRREVPGQRA
jgi:hypothetical protein